MAVPVAKVVDAAGVDTWSVCWYLAEDSAAVKAMQHLATDRAGRSMMLKEPVCEHRVGWFPGSRLLFAEGHPDPSGLARSDTLPFVLDQVLEGLQDRGILPPNRKLAPRARPAIADGKISIDRLPVTGGTGFGGIRRLDATVNLGFDDPLEGLAVLNGVASLPLPRMKTQVMREVGGRRVETVYFRGTSGKRVLGRWYDKGVESGDARRGMLVRPEDQRRFPKAFRPDVESVASGTFVRDAFVRRFEPLWRASRGVRVAGTGELAERIAELLEDGEITPGQAKSVAGYLLLDRAGGCGQSQRQERRDRALARRHGLVLADGAMDDVDVDLGAVLERALDAEVWGAQG